MNDHFRHLPRPTAVAFFTVLAVASAPSAHSAEPVVSGWQRFHAAADADPAAGGRLLLGELNCVACHAADEALEGWIDARPAPVLDAVALRVKPEFVNKFLAAPHAIKPGSTMPHLLGGDEATRAENALALTHFLAAGGDVPELRSDPAAAKRGETLFHDFGCVACHNPRKEGAEQLATSVPLGPLNDKYSIISLGEFLQNPHAVRAGGRMPSLNLDEKQARDIAHYFITDADPKPTDPRLTYRVYHGSYSTLPDFATLTPVAEGALGELSPHFVGRSNDFAIVFEGFLKIDRAGDYAFTIGSDDGSRLMIDGKLVANNDGVHPHTETTGTAQLEAGVHPFRIDYAQVAGEQSVAASIAGPGVPTQPLTNFSYPTADATRPEPKEDDRFRADPALVEKGRGLFASLGCANCHQMKEGDAVVASTKTAPKLASLKPDAGCLAAEPPAGVPDYDLSVKQRSDIAAALAALPDAAPTPGQRIDATLVAFNCVACHVRDGLGGVEPGRNAYFTSEVPEMGDEGRLPPLLTGTGDKLKQDWLSHVLAHGADDRQYMHAKMPNFGERNVGFLAAAFNAVDARDEAPLPTPDLTDSRAESLGRQLVGDSALSCIKCHNFGEYKGTGIPGIGLQTMSKRLRADWFHRYMLDPQKYRPGTRMPSAFFNGRSAVGSVLDGEPGPQLAVIWKYLSLREKAPVPTGVVPNAIVLTPTGKPIVYRNFIQGVSPRAIAVGYPERVNLAFDADQMSLALIWHNAFIDAGKHWLGRGNGFQGPLGDHVVPLVRGVPLAVLPDKNAAWPATPARDAGWDFRGYTLDPAGRPHLKYGTDALTVHDDVAPAAATDGRLDAGLDRTLTVTPADGKPLSENLTLRAATGGKIEPLGDGGWRIDDEWELHVVSDAVPTVRDSAGRKELLVPMSEDKSKVTLKYRW